VVRISSNVCFYNKKSAAYSRGTSKSPSCHFVLIWKINNGADGVVLVVHDHHAFLLVLPREGIESLTSVVDDIFTVLFHRIPRDRRQPPTVIGECLRDTLEAPIDERVEDRPQQPSNPWMPAYHHDHDLINSQRRVLHSLSPHVPRASSAPRVARPH
jgi:hypothetical protein